MRLLKRENGLLTFTEEKHPYAILSHTWDKELTYQDVLGGASNGKIEFLLDQAAKDGIGHVWIDTCCINKHDFTELVKSINLMYTYYQRATVCYVYLSDVPEKSLAQSRWFTRGWTLQEMIAPVKLVFFDKNAKLLGDRQSLQIERITGVPLDVASVSVVERFSWVINRQTTEPEDKSWCMLGLLDVQPTITYGIGADEAQKRLLEEVQKRYGSLTVERMQKQLFSITELLSFPYMGSRKNAIERPLHTTCGWLLEHPSYRRWLDAGGLLWIKGHPGTGKSTLMKFADLSVQSEVQISFFFNARGAELERSTVGMYRSLIVQLIQRLPGIETQIKTRWGTHRNNQYLSLLADLPALKEIFSMAVEHQPVRCFIDALDEAEISDIQDVVKHCRNLARAHPFSVCLASRYYPALSIKDSIEIRLDQQQQHLSDLAKYVQEELEDGDVQQEVIDRAHGVFLWAVLVVQMLNEELINGTPQNQILVIRSLPRELSGIYLEIIARQHGNIDRFRLCIQLLIFLRTPLLASELYGCILGLGNTPTLAVMERLVASASRGLAEIVQGRVQFIHESVRDFFLKHDGLSHLDIDGPTSHDRIASTLASLFCSGFSALASAGLTLSEVADPNGDVLHPLFDFEEWASRHGLSLLTLAVRELLGHADKGTSTAQEELIATFPWKDFAHVCKLLRARVFTHNMSHNFAPLHIFASFNATRLIEAATRLGHDVNSLSWPRDGHLPLGMAIFARARKVIHQLLLYGTNLTKQGSRDILDYFEHWPAICNMPQATIWCPADARPRSGYSVVDNGHARLFAIDCNETDLLRMFIAYGYDVNHRNEHGRTALIAACQRGLHWAIEVLLEHGANPNVATADGMTPLMLLALEPNCSHNNMVSLLDAGACKEAIDGKGRTALLLACKHLLSESVHFLLKQGASVRASDHENETVLSYVIKAVGCWHDGDPDHCQHAIVIGLLLEYGASADMLIDGRVFRGASGHREWCRKNISRLLPDITWQRRTQTDATDSQAKPSC